MLRGMMTQNEQYGDFSCQNHPSHIVAEDLLEITQKTIYWQLDENNN